MVLLALGALLGFAAFPLPAQTLPDLVNPSTVFQKDGKPVAFALHGFIEFQNLDQLFPYIDSQAGRWRFPEEAERQKFANDLLNRGIESRIVSMVYEKPLELLLTHTRGEVEQAISRTPPVFQGRHWRLNPSTYTQAFLRVQSRWKTSLNCWSASPSIAGRVLSNWYLIDEGIPLYGAVYDSTEHFWQAVKYHPGVRVQDLLALLDRLEAVDWPRWLQKLDSGQKVYLAHPYAIEFLRNNLAPQRREWFREKLKTQPGPALARQLQQRDPGKLRFTAFEEKTLWGDLADVFHLLYFLNKIAPLGETALLPALVERHFDGIYLNGERMDFIGPRFRELMLEIWKVKFIRMQRFGDVIRSIPPDVKLDHFLNDGDSPDIPIPVYVKFLNQIRQMALKR